MIGNATPWWNTQSANLRFTPEGGLAMRLINKTGAPSVKGLLLNTETAVDFGANIVHSTIDEPDIVGVIYENGIADGEKMWVVFQGVAEVLIDDGAIATRGFWCRTSATTDGRVDITVAAPGGGTINAIDGHFREVGHCLESKASGTDVLVKIVMHFN